MAARTYSDIVREMRSTVRELTPGEVESQVGAHPDTVLLDVREEQEWEQGHIPGAVFMPRGLLEASVESVVADRERPIVTYCDHGIRSLFAAKTLEQMGYANVVSMSGGYSAWAEQRLPWGLPAVLRDDQKTRYSRHLLLPEIGVDGQQKLLSSRVLVVGAGGLGAPAALYLAAAGVGTIGIVDFDVVDLFEPTAPGDPPDRSSRDEEDGVGTGGDPGAQSGRHRRDA